MSDIHNEISYICSSKPELSVSNSYIIKHQSKRLNVLAIQVPPFLRHFHSPFKVCLIVTEIKERILEIHKQLRTEFDLTNSEIITLELLSAGNTPNTIARLLSLQPNSIRQRLKSIYEKIGVNGQIELVNFYNNLL